MRRAPNHRITGQLGFQLVMTALATWMWELRVDAAIVAWDGSCGNNFWASVCGSMTNWNNDQQTTLGDQVSIGPGDPVVSVVFDAQTNSLTCESGLTINASLELAGSGTIWDLTVNSIAQRALKINAGQVTLNGTTSWTNGRVGGAGVLRNESLLTGAIQTVDTTTFVNAAQTQLRGGNLGADTVAINSEGGSFMMKSPAVGSQISLSGTGMLVNHGTFEHQHLANAIINVDCPYLQDTGFFDVNTTGVSGATTFFRHSATFSGGEFTIAGDARVHFIVPGTGAIYTFDGLPAVTGNGNLHFSTPMWSEVRVLEDLNVNLTGTDGLVINNTFTTLGGALVNQGKAKWGGVTMREAAGHGVPQFRNESSLMIAGSGISLQTWFRNMLGATVSHNFGGISVNDNGLIDNHGTYRHYRGNISRASNATFGAFSNYGTYVRPADPNTMNESFSLPFVLNPGSIARFEKATTEFAFGIGSGTFFLGGNMEVWENALVRVGGGSCEQADSTISDKGQFHFGGFTGGSVTFLIDDGRTLTCDLGPDGPGDPATGGAYLDHSMRLGGLGELKNIHNLFWGGGGIGNNGHGRVRNTIDGFTHLTSGSVNPGGEFINEGLPFDSALGFPLPPAGFVKHTGTLTLQDGKVTNGGYWRVETGSTIQGSGMPEFCNTPLGLFQNAIPAAQTTSVNVRFNNEGLVHARSGILGFSNVAQVSGNTLTGGWWKIDPGATLDLPGILTIIGIGARVDCAGTWNDLSTIVLNVGELNIKKAAFNQSVTNNGTMGVNTSTDSETSTIQNGNGNLNNQTPTALFYANTQTVPTLAGPGGGSIPFDLRCATFNNGGIVGPGGPGHAGPLKIDGNFNQSAAGTLQIELGGSVPVTEYDQFIVDGNVVLDGSLAVSVLPGFSPPAGQQFTIITASNGTISGQFDQIIGLGQFSLAYSPTSVVLTVVTPPVFGDIAPPGGDGVVDVNDLLAVINAWGVCPGPCPPSCTADISPLGSGDCAVNVDDLLAVINAWGP